MSRLTRLMWLFWLKNSNYPKPRPPSSSKHTTATLSRPSGPTSLPHLLRRKTKGTRAEKETTEDQVRLATAVPVRSSTTQRRTQMSNKGAAGVEVSTTTTRLMMNLSIQTQTYPCAHLSGLAKSNSFLICIEKHSGSRLRNLLLVRRAMKRPERRIFDLGRSCRLFDCCPWGLLEVAGTTTTHQRVI